ncbi:MAG: porin family protein, partial [Aestuariivirgaceae bacterium]|nr:porin family protein [Aestuariivirgaceae bacterium]
GFLMTTAKISILALASMLAVSATATAADMSTYSSAGGMYVFGMGGMANQSNLKATQDGVDPDEENVTLSLDNGYSVSGGLGYNLGNGLRLEAEIGYMKSDTDTITLPDYAGGISDDAPGDLSGTYGMASVWYALDTGAIRPFVGGGIGIMKASADSGPYFGNKSLDDSDTAFAWQVGGGLEMDMSSNLQLVARYRYLATSDFTLQDIDDTDITSSVEAHLVDVGLRLNF